MENVRNTQGINIALLGLGTVGFGVYRVLKQQQGEMKQKLDTELHLKKILVRKPEKYKDKLDDPTLLTSSWEDIISDDSIKIVIEVMGGMEPAKTYITEALEHGKSVVTANKDLIAEFGSELIQCAEAHHVDLRFEASVAGGIPIISPLNNSLEANDIDEVMGIVNGTTNYMLTQMTENGMDYDEALKEAQELGYAEADPTADVEGYDAGRKIAIMAQIAFHTKVTFSDVYTEGITQITARDIAYAKALGWIIKLIGIAKDTPGGIEVRVHPMLIPMSHPLATVRGSYNAVLVHGNAVDDVMFYGRGAGDLPTASAVCGDIYAVARHIVSGSQGTSRDNLYRDVPIKKIGEIYSSYYLRLEVEDRPGVLATIASVFGNTGVSIEQVIQKDKIASGAELVVVTNNVEERNIKDALLLLNSTSTVKRVASVIRVYR